MTIWIDSLMDGDGDMGLVQTFALYEYLGPPDFPYYGNVRRKVLEATIPQVKDP